MCHSLFQHDEFYIDSQHSSESQISENANTKETSTDGADRSQNGSPFEETMPGSINQLEGILSFIYQVKAQHDDQEKGQKKYNPKGVRKLYKKFLSYKHFFSLARPLIICEGKTDVIYLKCALRQLEFEYRQFVEKKDDRFAFKIGFLNWSKNLKDVFVISEGSPGLASLMNIYQDCMKPFKGQGRQHPVMMLVDNDSGSKEIKKNLKIKEFSEPFYYFGENLYVVPVASGADGGAKAIEDLFDSKVLETKVEDKTFSRKTKFDSKKEYGKIVFAEKVVNANQNSIDFNAFREILDRFKKVLADYSQKRI